MTTLRGACHCGNISVEFETGTDPHTLQLRECQCSFCRKHGARTASDAAGRLRISVREPDLLVRYRFALGVTDFLICKPCGVYVAPTTQASKGVMGALNVNVLDEREPFLRRAEPVRYFRETVEQRMSRRLLTWMPVEVRG
ncbi:MAG: GFA family protein [Polyangiales bacterium]